MGQEANLLLASVFTMQLLVSSQGGSVGLQYYHSAPQPGGRHRPSTALVAGGELGRMLARKMEEGQCLESAGVMSIPP